MKCTMIITGLILLALLPGCCGLRHLSGDEFMKKAEIISEMNSAIGCQYIGISHQRAYLEYWDVIASGNNGRTIIYWTQLTELPSNVVQQLKAGTPPWKPWEPQGRNTD